jgi:membrane protein
MERMAATPWRLPLRTWRLVAGRAWREANDDNIGLVAAGVAFYGFLALVPLLASFVLLYGFFADPADVARDMRGLTGLVPTQAAELIGEQLLGVVRSSAETKGLGLLLALALALWAARNGAAAIVTALNIAYEVKETRSFLRTNALALLITGAAILIGLAALYAVAALGHLQAALPGLPGWMLALAKGAAYPVLVLGGAAGAATLYRYAPDRPKARWVWLEPGSLLAALLWLLLTIGFGLYAAGIGDYGATYGSLSAVVVLLTWLYLSGYVLLLGAELNSELEAFASRETRQEARVRG